MRAEIISIGTELLVGSILNTNARFLSLELASQAIDVYRRITVGDNVERIVECLKSAAGRSDLLITSGGLGPTEDDVTNRAVSSFLGKPPVFHRPTEAYIRKRLKKRSLKMTRLTASQCYVPQGARVFQNFAGTAPATLSEFEWDGKKRWLLVLPGPPRELEPLFHQAWPVLRRMASARNEHFEVRAVHLAGLLEVQVAQKVGDLLKLKPPVTVGIYARPQEVELKIMVKAASRVKALRLAAKLERTIRARFKEKVYGVNHDSLASVTGQILRNKKRSLASAESCTGGLFSSLVTDIPGSSDYFKGGVITYSNEVKKSLLGVDDNTLKRAGAVSRQTALQMARKVRKILKSSYGVAITGIAGPDGGSLKKPAGLVFIAVSGPERTVVSKNLFLGDRAVIKLSAALKALDVLRLELRQK